jgi:hypothetical protein
MVGNRKESRKVTGLATVKAVNRKPVFCEARHFSIWPTDKPAPLPMGLHMDMGSTMGSVMDLFESPHATIGGGVEHSAPAGSSANNGRLDAIETNLAKVMETVETIAEQLTLSTTRSTPMASADATSTKPRSKLSKTKSPARPPPWQSSTACLPGCSRSCV